MSETLRDLVVSLSLNSDNFTRNIKSITKQLQEVQADFRLASAGIDGFDKTSAGAAARLTMLQRQVELQSRAVNQYKGALAQAEAKLKECYTRQGEYTNKLKAAKTAQSAMSTSVEKAHHQYKLFSQQFGELDSRTVAAKKNFEDLSEDYSDQCDEVKKLEGQVVALEKSTQNAADAVSMASTKLKENEAVLKAEQTELLKAQTNWTKLGTVLTEFSEKATAVGSKMSSVGRNMTMFMTTPILSLGAAAIKSSMSYESAFTSVRKTVDATEDEYARLSEDIKQMSTEVAASADSIAEVTAIAGQLGIQNDSLMEFTRTMIDLGNSTNISATEGASNMARFANIMGMNQSEFDNMGSALVDLGNNYATTESEILEMSLRLAGAGKQVGLTEPQILGYAAALSSVGIQAQMGGSAFSKALVKMEVAAETGGQPLQDFAKVCGMTSLQFKTLWDSNPAAAFQSFIVGLSKMDDEGISAIKTLNDIGISEIRLRDTLLRATNATDLFASTQETANRAWQENTALTEEANKRYATTESRITNLKNKAVLFGQTLGNDLNPTIDKLISSASDYIEKLLDMDSSQREQIVQSALMVAGIGPVLSIFGKLTTGVGKVAGVFGTFSKAVGTAKAAMAVAQGVELSSVSNMSALFSVVSKSPVAWLALGAAVTVAAVALVDYLSGAKAIRKATKEAHEGMKAVADEWRNTAADTFYKQENGLDYFSISREDFVKDKSESVKQAREWYNSVMDVWQNNNRSRTKRLGFVQTFKDASSLVREELESIKSDASGNGYTNIADNVQADIDTLNSLDKQVDKLLAKAKARKLTEDEQSQLQSLLSQRHDIEVKYHLSSAEGETGFDDIAKKIDAEVARARARGETDADVSVYQSAVTASAEGMKALTEATEKEYDARYNLIHLNETADESEEKRAERQRQQSELDEWYLAEKQKNAQAYAEALQKWLPKAWDTEETQKTKEGIDALNQALVDYNSAAPETDERAKALQDMDAALKSLSEGGLVDYLGMLMQITSLKDMGFSDDDINSMFPTIFPEDSDYAKAISQYAAISEYLNIIKTEAPDAYDALTKSVPDELINVAEQFGTPEMLQRVKEFQNGNFVGITPQGIDFAKTQQENKEAGQQEVELLVSKVTYAPTNEDGSAGPLTINADGLASLTAYLMLERDPEFDPETVSPEDITAWVSAYEEIAAGADTSELSPNDIVAKIMEYISPDKPLTEEEKKKLSPTLHAFVDAYQLTEDKDAMLQSSQDELTPSLTAWIVSYFTTPEAKTSLTKMDKPQVQAMIEKFGIAMGLNEEGLVDLDEKFFAAIGDVKWAGEGDMPEIPGRILVSQVDTSSVKGTKEEVKAQSDNSNKNGYTAYGKVAAAQALSNTDTSVMGIVRYFLSNRFSNYKEDANLLERIFLTKVNKEGLGDIVDLDFGKEKSESLQKYLASLVAGVNNPDTQLDSQQIADLRDIVSLVTTLSEINVDGDVPAISRLLIPLADTISQLTGEKVKAEDLGTWLTGLLGDVGEAAEESNVAEVISPEEGAAEEAGTKAGEQTAVEYTDAYIKALSEYLKEKMPEEGKTFSGITFGKYDNLPYLNYSQRGWNRQYRLSETNYDAEFQKYLTDNNLWDTINGQVEDFSESSGDNVGAGVGKGMEEHDMSGHAETLASNTETAVNTAFDIHSPSKRMIPVGMNISAGIAQGILEGQSSIVFAMQRAAQAAVNAAKQQLQIHSPSRVFRDEVGAMTMRGFGEGVLEESTNQGRIIQNAARYLTREAQSGTYNVDNSRNQQTYNQESTVSFAGSNFYINDKQDAYSLALEISSLTRKQQRGKGMRNA